MALTDKQARFVEEYLIDLNATQAAIRAGYSEKTANEQGSRLLANVSIQVAIQEKQKAHSEATGLTVAGILNDLETLYKEAREAKQFGPAVKAKELQGKHLGAFTEKVQISGSDDLPPIQVTFKRPNGPASS